MAGVALVLMCPAARADIALQTRIDIRAGTAPTDIAVTTGSRPQVLVAHDGGVLRFQTGQGQLTYAGQIDSVPFVKSIALTDVTGDGSADLVCVDARTPALHVLPARNDGTFGDPIRVSLPERPIILKARPIQDARRDVLFVVHDEGVSVLQRPAPQELRAFPVSRAAFVSDLEVSDIDGDGLTDLILAQASDHRLLFLPGEPGGSWGNPELLALVDTPERLFVDDIDADGDDDLIVVGRAGLTVFTGPLRPASGIEGRQGSPVQGRLIWPASQLGGIAAGDVDADGRLDLVVADRSRSVVTLLIATGNGGFRPGDSYGTGRKPEQVVLADVSGDSQPDVLVLNHLGDSVTYLRARGSGGFDGSRSLLADARDLSAITAADFDGDSHLDLAVTSAEDGTVIVLLGNGQGRFVARPPLRVAGQPRAMVAAHFGSDPLPDLAVADFAADEVLILTGDGRGGFAAPLKIPVGAGPSAIVAGRFQEHGRLDLAVANTLSDSVSILFGDGTGGFPRIESVAVGKSPSFLLIGDVNKNGHADLVVGNDRSERVVVFPGSPEGLGTPKTDSLADRVRPLVAEDLDRDGNVELVVIDQETDEVRILPATAPGRFGLPLPFPVGHHPSAVAAGDFDEDGLPDLAVMHGDSRTVSILLNITKMVEQPSRP